MKNLKHSIYLGILIGALTGCNREINVTDVDNQTFHHSYSMPGNERCYSVSSTKDGFLVIGSKGGPDVNDENSIVILRTNTYGKLLSLNAIESDSFFIPWISPQPDGSFLICPNELGRHLYKLDNSGNILFKSRFEPRSFFSYFSLPMIKNDGSYALAASSYTFKNDEFILFNQSGTFERSVRISLPNIVRAADHICLYRMEDTSTYYYYGIVRPSGNNVIGNIFIAKQTYQGDIVKSGKELIVDINNTSDDNFPESRVNLKHLLVNGGVLLYNTQLEPGGNTKGYLAMFDKDLNKLWEKELKITNSGTSPKNIILCNDGNLMIVGSCTSVNNKLDQPFICKMDLNGKILWSKIISVAYAGSLNAVAQISDDQFLFGGTTIGSGRGLNLNDIFLLRTDSQGNLKSN